MTTTPPPGRTTPSMLWPAAALALALVAAKAVLLEKPEGWGWGWQLVAATWQDLLAASVYGLGAAALLRLTAARPRAQRLAWRLLIVLGALALAYTVVHVGFYDAFRRAINVQMLRFAGNVKNLASSVTARVTWPSLLALLGLPLLFAAGFLARPRGASRRARLAAMLLASAWALAGRELLRRSGLEWLERMAENPHAVLLSSLVLDLRGRASVSLPRDFPRRDLDEFRPFAERGGPPPVAPPARVRNVIFVVLESTGTRYLGLYGSRYDTTPRLQAEAAHSLVLDNFYANVSHTVCSFMVLNFSLYPGLPWCYVPCGQRPLPPSLPELLQPRGHRTALISSADMNYEGMAWAAERHGYQSVRSYWDLGCPLLNSWGADDQCVFEGILRFVDEQPGAPFYVMAWTNQTHDPYVTSPGRRGVDFARAGAERADLARYLDILHTIDEQIGRLLDGLRERGLADDTLVVITGDHGEAFGEPHDYAGHGSVLYDEGVRVPLVLWNPRLFGGSGRSRTVGSHVDLNPTLAELLGLAPPGGWQGRSLFDPSRPDRAYFVAGLGEYQFGVREGEHKYIYSATFGSERLYDLERDPDELENRAAEHPELCRRQRQRLAAWIAYEEEFLLGTPAGGVP